MIKAYGRRGTGIPSHTHSLCLSHSHDLVRCRSSYKWITYNHITIVIGVQSCPNFWWLITTLITCYNSISLHLNCSSIATYSCNPVTSAWLHAFEKFRCSSWHVEFSCPHLRRQSCHRPSMAQPFFGRRPLLGANNGSVPLPGMTWEMLCQKKLTTTMIIMIIRTVIID